MLSMNEKLEVTDIFTDCYNGEEKKGIQLKVVNKNIYIELYDDGTYHYYKNDVEGEQ